MRGPKPQPVELDAEMQAALHAFVSRHRTPQQLAVRARIVLLAAEGLNNTQIARQLGLDADTVRCWRQRWLMLAQQPLSALPLRQRFADAPRSGAPTRIEAEVLCQIMALACRPPHEVGRPITEWTARELADEVRHQGLVESISPRHVGRFLKGVDLKPHLSRYWLTPGEDPDKDTKIADVCALYEAAPALAERGERVISTDEMTGVQALERKHPGLPLAPGKVARREFEYIRHGTATFLLNLDVASGQAVAPTCGTTRTEADFLAHAKQTVQTDPLACKWHFVCDNLNIHLSQSLVRWVAEVDALDIDLGEFGKSGILHNTQTRAAFLSDPSHSIVFHYTPKHASWMNQIEIWLSILVRKVIRRGNFTSIEDVQAKVLAFIDYFNQTMAKPFAWTFKGKVLTV